MKAEIVQALPEHVPAIMQDIREDDRRELALLGMTPEGGLEESLKASLAAWTGMIDDTPICMFGVSSWPNGTGRPWMIGTNKVVDHQKVFLRRCRPCVDGMQYLFPYLQNYVSVDNVRAIGWLVWLGFSFAETIEVGPRGARFHRFWKSR